MQNEVFLANIQNLLKSTLYGWSGVIKTYAINLFVILALIYLSVKIILMILDNAGSLDASKLLSFFIRFSFITSFFYFILENGIKYASMIANYFISIGQDGLGYDGIGNKGAVDRVLDTGLLIWESVNKAASGGWINTISTVPFYLIALIIYILLIVIVANYIVEVASAWILIYAGYFVLAFGSTEWTRETVINYFKAVVAIGLKIITVMLLIGITVDMIEKQLNLFEGKTFDFNNGAIMLITVIIMAMIMNKVPDAIAALVSGAWGHMSAVNMASAVATAAFATSMAKQGLGLASQGASGAVSAAKNFKQGMDDKNTDINNSKEPNNAMLNQLDTFTNKNSNDFKTQNGSGFFYSAGRGTALFMNNFQERFNKTSGADFKLENQSTAIDKPAVNITRPINTGNINNDNNTTNDKNINNTKTDEITPDDILQDTPEIKKNT